MEDGGPCVEGDDNWPLLLGRRMPWDPPERDGPDQIMMLIEDDRSLLGLCSRGLRIPVSQDRIKSWGLRKILGIYRVHF